MRVLLKRVPKKTDPKVQSSMMEEWYNVIVETYMPPITVPVNRADGKKSIIETKEGKCSASGCHKDR